jgi:hypothetical protein
MFDLKVVIKDAILKRNLSKWKKKEEKIFVEDKL